MNRVAARNLIQRQCVERSNSNPGLAREKSNNMMRIKGPSQLLELSVRGKAKHWEKISNLARERQKTLARKSVHDLPLASPMDRPPSSLPGTIADRFRLFLGSFLGVICHFFFKSGCVFTYFLAGARETFLGFLPHSLQWHLLIRFGDDVMSFVLYFRFEIPCIAVFS